MTVVIPPRRTRWQFWTIGRRLDPLYRPWVAEQIGRPDYALKRVWATIGLQFLLIVVPQTALALSYDNALGLLVPAALVVFYGLYVAIASVRHRPLSAWQRRLLLEYHGVTADGTITAPVSVWSSNPLGKAGLALLCAQVLVFSSGVAVAADRISAERRCHLLPAAHQAALAAVLPPGSELVAARESHSQLSGLHYVGAYVRDPSGRLLGPAVWRIADGFSTLNPAAQPGVDAWDDLARRISPDTGHGWTRPEDPAVQAARDCGRSAR